VFPEKARADEPSDAKYFASATSSSYGTAITEYVPGAAAEAVLRFQTPGRVEVFCEGIRGTRLSSRISASITPADESRRFSGRQVEKFSKEGVATIAPVQPGSSEVVLTLNDDFGNSTLVRLPLSVTSGAQRVAVTLPHLNSVTLRVKAGSGHAMLRRDDDAQWNRVVRGEGETIAVDALPDGSYKAHGPRGEVAFTLPGPAEVDLR
jgi:hypothetical protein